jgi:trehalose-6-phosphate synthase
MAAGLDMPAEERSARLARFRRQVLGWTAGDWLSAQFAALGLTLPRRGAPAPAGSS